MTGPLHRARSSDTDNSIDVQIGDDPMPFRHLIRRLQALRVKAYERNDRVAIATLNAAIGRYQRV